VLVALLSKSWYIPRWLVTYVRLCFRADDDSHLIFVSSNGSINRICRRCLRSFLYSQSPIVLSSYEGINKVLGTHSALSQTCPRSLQPPAQPAAKQYYATKSPWEAKIGYYRAVRRGPFIFVSGTTAVDPSSNATDAKVLHPGDAKAQAHIAFQEIIKAIQALGGRGAESIVRTKMVVQRQQDCGAVAEAFSEVGKQNGDDLGTAATMIVVGGFVDPKMLVEIECDAMVDA
jgi:enamine deaminase RidA (YjgF/YER057c/UK114 family)